MKLSQTLWQTFKEDPADAEVPSHKLMIRAGLIHKAGAGIYNWLPFGLRILKKIETVIRKEHDNIGCQEINMSVVTPGELWQKSGRWKAYGDEMLKFKDKGGRDLCISPTNEEAVTDVFEKLVKSYKQLPLTLYQINVKFRDEIRPRFGVMRGREFLMKDAYSFHASKECLDKTYYNLKQAYENIFSGLGLEYVVVEADAGAMASADQKTHEFQVVAETGEDTLVLGSDFACNLEKAITKKAKRDFSKTEKKLEKVHTPNTKTIEEVSKFLKINPDQTLKSLIYFIDKENKISPVMVVLCGSDQVNEVRLKAHYLADRVFVATDKDIQEMGLVKGSISPIESKEIEICFDNEVDFDSYYAVGANENDYHYVGFCPARDLKKQYEKASLRLSQVGDVDSKGNPITLKKGIEVGHIFQLGDKYTKSMKVNILDKNGKQMPPIMGCYGIGVTRLVGAAIEQNHDEKGIIWPKNMSPFQLHMVLIGRSEEFLNFGKEIYSSLLKQNVEILLDDRDVGPGFKFKDAELLGCPLQLVVGEKEFQENGKLKLVNRRSGEIVLCSPDKVYSSFVQTWEQLK